MQTNSKNSNYDVKCIKYSQLFETIGKVGQYLVVSHV